MQGKTTVNGGDRSSRFKRKSEPGLHHVRRSRAVRCTVSRSTGVSSAVIHSFPHSFIQAISGGHWAFEPRAGAEGHDTRVLLCAARRLPGQRGLSATAAPRTAARWLSRLTCEPQERPLLRGAREPTALSTAGGERHDPVFRGPGPPWAGCDPSRHACLVVLPRAQPRTRSAGSLVGFRCLTLRFVQSADEIYKKSSVNSEP